MLFFGIAAIDALSELHKIGHAFGDLLFRTLITASIIAIVLHLIGRRRTR
jgi:K+/H+ antiporter YhaU regulatory subunit KhtT